MASATAHARNPNKGSSGRNAGGPRSMWSGSITFGLVSIPVRLFTATREHRVRFHLLKKNDHSRIQRKYISSADEKEESVQNDELVRGYELSPNQFVIVSDEELSGRPGVVRRHLDRAIDRKLDRIGREDRNDAPNVDYLLPCVGLSYRERRFNVCHDCPLCGAIAIWQS